MKLKRVCGFDYLLVLLSNKTPLYRKDGSPISLVEIANLIFGKLKLMMDAGDICEEDKC